MIEPAFLGDKVKNFPQNSQIITEKRLANQIGSFRGKSIFMFKGVEHVFKDAEHVFKGVEHVFKGVEHKISPNRSLGKKGNIKKAGPVK